MASLQEVVPGLLRGPISDPLRPPRSRKMGVGNSSQNFHRKLRPNGTTHKGGLYWQPMLTYLAPYPKKVLIVIVDLQNWDSQTNLIKHGRKTITDTSGLSINQSINLFAKYDKEQV